MSRKISYFFNKKSIQFESNEENPEQNGNQSSTADGKVPVKLECKGNDSTLLTDPLNDPASNKNTGSENQNRINENVKNEAEKQCLVILQQQKVQKFPVPIKIEENEPKIDKLQCQICKKKYSSVGSLRKHKNIHDKKFGCQICDKKFPLKCMLLEHIRNVHENPGSYRCDICKVAFNSKAILKSHQKTHIKNRPKPFKCSMCNLATDQIGNYKNHLKTHERIEEKCKKCKIILRKSKTHDCRLDCKYCGNKFSHAGYVKNHIKKYHTHETERTVYECDICGLKYYHKKNVRTHIEAKHADGKIHLFTCDLDGKTFKSKTEIKSHMKTHLPPVKCDFCFKKLSVNNLKEHIQKFHTGIKQPRRKCIPKTETFQCQICSKILSTKAILERHVSEHNKTIKCKFCEKLFGNQSRHKDHVKNFHENKTEFICNICGKKYNQQSYLKSHMKTHDPNRLRNLKCSQCDYATYDKQSFEGHLNSHKRKNAQIEAMENPQKCPQCPAVRESLKSLKMHIYRVHPKVLFECDICGKSIKIKRGLLQHFRSFHKIGL